MFVKLVCAFGGSRSMQGLSAFILTVLLLRQPMVAALWKGGPPLNCNERSKDTETKPCVPGCPFRVRVEGTEYLNEYVPGDTYKGSFFY